MVTQQTASLDSSLSRYAVVADDASVTRARAALEANGITVLRAADAGGITVVFVDEALGF